MARLSFNTVRWNSKVLNDNLKSLGIPYMYKVEQALDGYMVSYARIDNNTGFTKVLMGSLRECNVYIHAVEDFIKLVSNK